MRAQAVQDGTEPSDAELLARYAGGSGNAAAMLAGRHASRLVALATRMLGEQSEAEDIAQEALLRLWRQAPHWRADGEAEVGTWLYRVASNLCIDRLRKRARTRTPLDAVPEPADPGIGAVEMMQEKSRADALDAALAQLPPRQRQAVVLRHLDGLANPQIAQIMEIGVEAVESLTARGKRALSLALAGRRAELGYVDD